MNTTEVTAGLAESNDSLLLGLWRDSLYVTCGLTACTPLSLCLSFLAAAPAAVFGTLLHTQSGRVTYIQLPVAHWAGSVAEWLAFWTQAQKGLGSNRNRDAVG